MPHNVEFKLGDYLYDSSSGTLRRSDGAPQPLRAQSAQVLALLAARPNEVVPKNELFDTVWPDIAVTDDSLTQCIADIRKALQDTDRTILRTVPRKGYQLVTASVPHPAGPALPWRQRPILRRTKILGALGVLGLVFAALILLRGLPEPGADQADLRNPSIIVLPIKDLSPEGDLGHFADGMTEDLITGLSRWEDFEVVDRTTAMSFKGSSTDIREIAARTQTQYALEGSIRRIGDTMRVTAQLVNTETGRNLWANRYDETGTDILALYDGIITRIERSLIGTMGVVHQDSQRRSWARGSVGLDEYDYVLRGHSLFYEFTPDAMVRALQVWGEGLDRYPDSGYLKIKQGWGRIICNRLKCALGPFDPQGIVDLVNAGLAAPDLSSMGRRHGLWLRLFMAALGNDPALARTTARDIADQFPSDVEGLLLGVSYLTYVGALDEAGALVARAGPLRQRPMPYFYFKVAIYHYARDDCEAARPYLHAGPFPSDALIRAGCYVEFGDLTAARAELDRLADKYGIRGPDQLPSEFDHMHEVRARLLAQLATVGWPD